MKPSPWDIMVLKPSRVFQTFLAAQVGEEDCPDFSLIQTDKTAYILPKMPTDEETLDIIEANFPKMFRHEIARWLGPEVAEEMEASFLDFLCCFKFELHSQIVLMEPELTDGLQMLRIKPRSLLLKWMKSTVSQQKDLHQLMEGVKLSHLTENATVVVKHFSDLNHIRPFLHRHYKPVFETEMKRMCEDADLWPELNDYETFMKYFSVEVHTQLIDLSH